jgi:hypothetical protein
MHDIEKNTNESFGRVTVYRTLQTFVEKGILLHNIQPLIIPSYMRSVKTTAAAGHLRQSRAFCLYRIAKKPFA